MTVTMTATPTVSQAADNIRAGELAAFPTETVYGLGADASDDAAVAKIFAAKGRPADHPLIVHIAGQAQVLDYASSLPPFAKALIEAFWPGPLTVILPRRPGVATAAAGGQDSIGLRCPAHPLALAFLKACNTGVAGACTVGIESSIVDCTRGQPVLLRPGVLTREQLSAACGQVVLSANDVLDNSAPRAPGTLESHYAPNAQVRLMDANAIQTALDVLGADAAHIAVYARSIVRISSSQVLYRRMPDDALATAEQLFAVLRDFDAQGVKLIWIEPVPDAADWDGVRDRLGRAAAS